MARRKKAKKRTSRRRRVGAMSFNPNSPLVKYGSLLLGFVLANKINPAIDKITGGKIDDKIIAGVSTLGGGYYLFMHKGKKNLIVTAAAGVAAGAGIKRGMAAFGIGSLLGGYGKVPVLGNRRVAGYHGVPVLGNRVNGYDAGQMVGAYRSNPKPFPNSMAGVDTGSGVTNTGGGGCMM